MKKELGFTITIHCLSPDPNGIRTITKSNWTGQGVIFSRGDFIQMKKTDPDRIRKPGTYLLIGKETGALKHTVYVGEGDDVLDRITIHYSDIDKEFWQECIVFNSSHDFLNKAFVSYIESRLLSILKDKKSVNIFNHQSPKGAKLSEADQDIAEAFLQEMILCLQGLGYNFFEDFSGTPDNDKTIFYIKRGKSFTAEATGEETKEGFLVHKEAKIRSEKVESLEGSAASLRGCLNFRLGI